MKALYEDISTKKGAESFFASAFSAAAFEFKWHYHPEYELTLITKGYGKRLIGDSYENFQINDLVLLGPGLPHTWSSEFAVSKNVSAVVIQFSEDFIGNFLQLNEFNSISNMLASSSRGLFFPKSSLLNQELSIIPKITGVYKLTSFINILQKLTEQPFKKLSSEYFIAIKGEETENRINKVCQYISNHSAEKITLEQTADLIYLSRSAFSKFFKRATGKTFSDYVNEIRIGNACQLLLESDKTISLIAAETGFESLTYFNRVFLKKKKCSPRDFRYRLKK